MGRVKPEHLFRVTLSCGCRIPLRDRPMPTARFSCGGTGHGYRLAWKAYVEPGGKTYAREGE